MLRGFYSAANGMLITQHGLNVSANNMANIKTPGFKAERAVNSVFLEEYLYRQNGSAGDKDVIGSISSITTVEEVQSNFDESSISESTRPYDMSIVGQGFFNVQTENGQRVLTRNGAFDIDEQGYLVLPKIGRVLGENGPLRVMGSDFIVSKDGQVFDGEGNVVGTMLITQPEPGTDLLKMTNGMYQINNLNQNTQLVGAGIQQYSLENSNINLNQEFSLVMDMQKTFKACSNALKSIDQINGKTVSEIARI